MIPRRANIAAAGMGGPMFPPLGELEELCARAREVAGLCDLVGVGSSDRPHQVVTSSMKPHVELQDVLEDPDERPYLWDLED